MSDEEHQSILDLMEDDDWALILDPEGNLKGLFIPEGKEEDEVPPNIVYLMEEFFGIDFDDELHTVH